MIVKETINTSLLINKYILNTYRIKSLPNSQQRFTQK